MTIAQKQRKWTVEEFLVWHEQQEERYELIQGVPMLKRPPVSVTLPGASAPTMMTGASLRHNKVNSNLSLLLGNQLAGGPCNVFANDAAIETAADQVRYPDLVIDCETRIDQGYLLSSPKLVIEILSQSTKSFDLLGKLTEYWQVATIAHVMIVDPDLLRVQLHVRRSGEGPTVDTFSNSEDVIDISEIGVILKLADIFAGLLPVTDQ